MRQGATSQRHEKSPLILLNPTFYINHLKTHKRQNQMVPLCNYYVYITYIPFKNLIYVTSIIFTQFLRRISLYIATATMVRHLAVIALLSLLACRSRSWVQRWPQQSRTPRMRARAVGIFTRCPEKEGTFISKNLGNAWENLENHGKHDGIIA